MLTAISKITKNVRKKKGVLASLSGDNAVNEIYRDNVREKSYAYSVTALAAKLAMSDGDLNDCEMRSFSAFFRFPAEATCISPEKLLLEASFDPVPPEHYISRIKIFYPDNTSLYKEIIFSLFRYAIVDKPLNSSEIMYIKKVALSFGIGVRFFHDMLRRQIIPLGNTPHEVLAIPKNASKKLISKAYRNAVKLYHPDRFVSMEDNCEIMKIVNLRVQVINDANLLLTSNN